MFMKSSTIPEQWKQAKILPVPKVVSPKQHSDFRPISITSVLTRIMERIQWSTAFSIQLLSPPHHLFHSTTNMHSVKQAPQQQHSFTSFTQSRTCSLQTHTSSFYVSILVRRHYTELNESRQSRSWASQYPIVCLLLSTYIQPLVRARKLSMHSEFYVATA